PNCGKLIAITRARPTAAATTAGSSVGSSTTSGGESRVTICRFLIRIAIDAGLEGFDADAMHDVDEALGLAVALREIGFDQPLDDVGDVGTGERGPNDPADSSRGSAALTSSYGDLVPLLSVLVDAED